MSAFEEYIYVLCNIYKCIQITICVLAQAQVREFHYEGVSIYATESETKALLH